MALASSHLPIVLVIQNALYLVEEIREITPACASDLSFQYQCSLANFGESFLAFASISTGQTPDDSCKSQIPG